MKDEIFARDFFFITDFVYVSMKMIGRKKERGSPFRLEIRQSDSYGACVYFFFLVGVYVLM